MNAAEIPVAEWSHSLDQFSRDHVGWLASIEVMGAELGDQFEARALPLAGLSADPTARTVWVALAKSADDHITHSIEHVSRVRILEASAPSVQIESEGGTKTLVRLERWRTV